MSLNSPVLKLIKLGIEGNFLSQMKHIYQKHHTQCANTKLSPWVCNQVETTQKVMEAGRSLQGRGEGEEREILAMTRSNWYQYKFLRNNNENSS